MKKLKKIVLWASIIIYLGLAYGFFAGQYDKMICDKVDIKIDADSDKSFLVSEDILKILDKSKIKYLGEHINAINLNKIEQTVKSNQIISECKAYTGINRTLHIEVTQREPLVRIFDKQGRSYYIDKDGNILNLSRRYAPRVLVVNGNIRTPFIVGKPANIHSLRDSTAAKKLLDICTLVNFINNEDFWNAQIVQIYVNHDEEFELIPRVGPHIILLGDIEDYQEKFKKLEIFYKEGLNNVGWNQYLTINLKYKDQVVCTKI
jgi:cell division protein FtsQ